MRASVSESWWIDHRTIVRDATTYGPEGPVGPWADAAACDEDAGGGGGGAGAIILWDGAGGGARGGKAVFSQVGSEAGLGLRAFGAALADASWEDR